MLDRGAPPQVVAAFDSASAELRALARALQGREFPRLGQGHLAAGAVRAANLAPLPLRRQAYALSGILGAVAADRLGDIDAEQVADWMAGHYPRRRYPAVAVGSSNGAALSLYAALGVPWLPQTYLIPVRHRLSAADEPRRAMDFGAETAQPLLANNPDLTLHHMHDPNQDRLMVRGMAYFRVKRRRLGAAYERFLTDCLAPGAPVLLMRHDSRWPTTRVGDRHVFQFGACGGATPDEYLHGGPRVRAFLRAEGAGRDRWDPPEPDGESPEAEWGFEPALADDVRRWAGAHGHPVREIAVPGPEDLSPVVADIHRRWYASRGLPTDRLLVESFILHDPVATLRSGCVPFWTMFPVEPSLQRLSAYLDDVPAYREIGMLAFQHGVRSIGVAQLDGWRAQLARATERGAFLGLDESRYPADFAVYARYGPALQRLRPRYRLPAAPLPLAEVDALLPGRWW